jgi:hypothetical protein
MTKRRVEAVYQKYDRMNGGNMETRGYYYGLMYVVAERQHGMRLWRVVYTSHSKRWRHHE